MCWVMPPASPSATLVLRMWSRRVVLPWSTWPMTVTTGARRGASGAAAFFVRVAGCGAVATAAPPPDGDVAAAASPGSPAAPAGSAADAGAGFSPPPAVPPRSDSTSSRTASATSCSSVLECDLYSTPMSSRMASISFVSMPRSLAS